MNNDQNNNQDQNQYTNEELQRLLNDNSQNPQQQNIYPQTPQPSSSDRTMAGLALAFGIIALTLPVPVLDVIFGIAGLILAIVARRKVTFGLATAGLVLSIIGLIAAIGYTYYHFTEGGFFTSLFAFLC